MLRVVGLPQKLARNANGVMDALSGLGIAQLPMPQNVWKGDQGGEDVGVNRLSFSTSAQSSIPKLSQFN